MPLADEIDRTAQMLEALQEEPDQLKVVLVLRRLPYYLRDIAARVAAIEAEPIPPHLRNQWWDGSGSNIVSIRKDKR